MAVLKIIGLILLGILGILLLLLILLLFAPFRYEIKGSFQERRPDGLARVKWLFGVLGFRAAYHQGEALQAYISVCGFKVLDLLGGSKDEGKSGTQEGGEDDFLYSPDLIYSAEKENASSTEAQTVQPDAADSGEAAGVKPEAAGTDLAPGAEPDTAQPDQELSVKPDAAVTVSVQGLAPDTAEAPQIEVTAADTAEAGAEAVPGTSAGISGKLSELSATLNRKLSDLEQRIESKINELVETVKAACISIKAAVTDKTDKARALYALYKEKQYQPALNMVKNRLLRLLRELKPRRGYGKIRYGSGDPYSTAQVMQIAVLLYPIYEDRIEVIPDFDSVSEAAELDLKGRLRLFIPAEAALRIFFNKKLRKLYHKARVILELEEGPADRKAAAGSSKTEAQADFPGRNDTAA